MQGPARWLCTVWLAARLGLLLSLAAAAHASPVVARIGGVELTTVAELDGLHADPSDADLRNALATPASSGPTLSSSGWVADVSSPTWLRFDLAAARADRSWFLEIPVVRLQDARLYWIDEQGELHSMQSGFGLPASGTELHDRYPVFALGPLQPEPRAYLLRLANDAPYAAVVRVTDETTYLQHRQADTLMIGGFLGVGLVAMAYAAAQALNRRDAVYGWFAAHAASMLLTHSTISGVLRLTPLGEWPAVIQGARALGTLAVVITTLMLIRQAVSPPVLGAVAHRLGSAGVVVGLALAMAYLWLPPALAWQLLNAYLLAALGIATAMLGRTRASGLAEVRWYSVGFAMILLPTCVHVLANLGVVPAGWWTGQAIVGGAALELVVIMYALSLASASGVERERPRRDSVDRVTGFLAESEIERRVNLVLLNHRRGGRGAALLLVDITNVPELVYQHGAQVTTPILEAAARCLMQAMRATDVPLRAGDTRLALLLRGIGSRQEVLGVTERVVELGLRHAPELPQTERLRFHCCVAYLPEDVRRSARSMLREMHQALDHLYPGSGLRIRELRHPPSETATMLGGPGLTSGRPTRPGELDVELPAWHGARVLQPSLAPTEPMDLPDTRPSDLPELSRPGAL